MAVNTGRIFAELGLDTTIGADLAKARAEMTGGLSSLGSGVTGALTGAASAITYIGVAAGATAAIVGGVAANSFKNFEQSVVNAASVTGLTGDAFNRAKENIAAVAQELGQRTVYSSSQAADALYNLASAGFDVANMCADDLIPILNLASATQTDLAQATEFEVGVMNQFGLTIKDLTHISDVFVASIGMSMATMDKLKIAFREVGPIGAMAGLGLEDVTAAFDVMFDKMFTGEQAGTGLKIILASLLNPSTEAQKTFKEMGLTFDEINPKTNKFSDIIATLNNHGLDTNKAFSIFGREGAASVLALTSNVDKLAKGTDQLKNSTGTAATVAGEQLDTFAGSWENMKGVIENVLINIGAALAPGIRAIAGTIADAGPGIQGALLGIVGFFTELGGKLGPSMENIKSIARDFVTIFGDIFKSTTGGQGNATDAIAGIFNSITKTISDAVPKIWMAINKGIKIFRDFKDGLTNVWNSLEPTFNTLRENFNKFVKDLGPTWDNLKSSWDSVKTIWDQIKTSAAPAIQAFLDSIKGATGGGAESGLVTIINGITGAISTFLKFIADHPEITQFAVDIATMVAKIVLALPAATLAILDFVGKIQGYWTQAKTDLQTFYTTWSERWNLVYNTISTVANQIWTTLQTWYNNLVNIYNTAKTALQDLYAYFQERWNALWTFLSGVVESIRATLQGWYDRLVEIFNNVKNELQNLWSRVVEVWNNIKQEFQDAKDRIIEKLQQLVTDAKTEIENLKNGILEKIDGIKTSIETKAQEWYDAGKKLADSLADGLKNAYDNAKKAVTGGNKEIDKQLPHSPAKEGVFRRLPKWDAVLSDPLKAGIAKIASARAGLQSQLKGLKDLMNFSQWGGQLNLTGNLEGFTKALHKMLDTPATQSNTTSSGTTSSGGTWSRTTTQAGTTTTQGGNMTQAQAAALLAKMEKLIQAQAPVITIKDVKLDQAYNFQKLIADVEKYQTAQRRQRGAYI